MVLDLLDLLGALPEEQVGADGGAEHGHDQGDGRPIELQLRPHDPGPGFGPVHVDDHHHGHIGEQHQGQPFQHPDVAVVGHQQLQQQGDDAEAYGVPGAVALADHHAGGLAHGGQVGPDVDGVGHEQQRHQDQHDRAGEHLLDVRRQALAGDPADPRRDHLDRRHQREGQDHGPQHVQAEARPGLGIGGDAGGVVVGRAGDHARTQPLEQGGAVQPRLDDAHALLHARSSGLDAAASVAACG